MASKKNKKKTPEWTGGEGDPYGLGIGEPYNPYSGYGNTGWNDAGASMPTPNFSTPPPVSPYDWQPQTGPYMSGAGTGNWYTPGGWSGGVWPSYSMNPSWWQGATYEDMAQETPMQGADVEGGDAGSWDDYEEWRKQQWKARQIAKAANPGYGHRNTRWRRHLQSLEPDLMPVRTRADYWQSQQPAPQKPGDNSGGGGSAPTWLNGLVNWRIP